MLGLKKKFLISHTIKISKILFVSSETREFVISYVIEENCISQQKANHIRDFKPRHLTQEIDYTSGGIIFMKC